MSLKDKIVSDLKEKMKSHDQFRVDVLRMLLASIHNREIEKQGKSGTQELTEDEVIEVLRKEAKKRKESIDIYMRALRHDLGEKEEKELGIIESYLPKAMPETEIEAIVRGVIGSGARDFGQVMKAAMSQIGGRAEARTVSEIVKKLLS